MPILSPAILADACMIQDQPNYNTELDHFMDVMVNITQARRSIFRFASIASIPAGSTITSAILTCDVTSSGAIVGGSTTVSVHVLTGEGVGWDELTVTWTNWIDGGDPTPWSAGGGDYLATNGKTSGLTWPATSGVTTFEIAPTIQWILDHNPTTPTWIVKAETEGGALTGYFRIKDATTGTRASLAITYSLPGKDGVRFAGYRGRIRGREVR